MGFRGLFMEYLLCVIVIDVGELVGNKIEFLYSGIFCFSGGG